MVNTQSQTIEVDTSLRVGNSDLQWYQKTHGDSLQPRDVSHRPSEKYM